MLRLVQRPREGAAESGQAETDNEGCFVFIFWGGENPNQTTPLNEDENFVWDKVVHHFYLHTLLDLGLRSEA